ncbi:STAS domain-containing protein [Dactylosporangium sp. CA-139066]|uniref:STAS domain-containing protein n=1 Tax=Dactylosporangium sp. CA-139066 TaxID=3239930 RepID=UPI003D8D3495
MRGTAGEAATSPIEVLVTGALTAATVDRWRTLADDAAATRPAHMVVDLTACDSLDTAGIDVLVEVHRRLWADGGRLTLRGVSARLSRLLTLARVDRVLQIADAAVGHHPRHRAASSG